MLFRSQNNGFIKNPFLYILIIVVLVTGFQYFFSGDTGGRSQQINYTELVKEIKENNVTEMSYQPNGSVVEISGIYKTPQESKEDTGILFFTPNVSKVERFTSIILPSDITISDLQKLASEHNTEISIKRESSSGMWITIFRCATRYYDPARKISQEDFDYILELGRLSPSSVGSEPWQFLVIQNPELRQALKPVSWGMATQLDDASHVVVILANKKARYDSDDFRQNLLRRGLNEEQLQQAVAKYETFQKKRHKSVGKRPHFIRLGEQTNLYRFG